MSHDRDILLDVYEIITPFSFQLQARGGTPIYKLPRAWFCPFLELRSKFDPQTGFLFCIN